MASLYADRPLAAVPTPWAETGQTDQFTMDASHMALVHNVMIRCYNSIYLQAPRIKQRDIPDFLSYCLAWYETVKGHHDSEEAVLFPMIEEATGVKGIMEGDIAEHEAFYGGLNNFKTYIDTCLKNTSDFHATRLIQILDTFGTDLQTHLAHEPPKLASLSKYSFDMKDLSDKTAQHSMKRSSTISVLPILWFNLDVDFENKKWASFPEVPGPVKWIMINVLGRWHSNWWRFGSSGSDGKLVPLLALKEDYAVAS